MGAKDPLVLVGDSGERWAGLLGAKLFRSGFRRRNVRSVGGLLRALDSESPDLALLDLDLPGATVSLAALVKKKAPAAKVILVTPPSTDLVLGPGDADAHVWKPADLELLRAAVESVWGQPLRPSAGAGAHVLCVDDDPLFLKSLERVLTRHDYRVTLFRDPRRVVEAIPALRPDLAILDVRMPELDGWTLARSIRTHVPGDLPILFMSGWPPGEDPLRSGGLLESACLPKPIEPEVVLAAIDRRIGAAKIAHAGAEGGR